jgi:hypothetical protein
LVPDSFSVAAIKISVRRERRENRYVKCEAVDSHVLVRTHAIHLRLDSQFNLSRLVIPIGIDKTAPDILPAGRNCEGFTRKQPSIKNKD